MFEQLKKLSIFSKNQINEKMNRCIKSASYTLHEARKTVIPVDMQIHPFLMILLLFINTVNGYDNPYKNHTKYLLDAQSLSKYKIDIFILGGFSDNVMNELMKLLNQCGAIQSNSTSTEYLLLNEFSSSYLTSYEQLNLPAFLGNFSRALNDTPQPEFENNIENGLGKINPNNPNSEFIFYIIMGILCAVIIFPIAVAGVKYGLEILRNRNQSQNTMSEKTPLNHNEVNMRAI